MPLPTSLLRSKYSRPYADGTNLTATSSGGTTGSSSFSDATLAYATEVAENEINHVRFLRSALGSLAVKCPSLSLSPATFTVAAKAAVSAYGKLISGRNNAGKQTFLNAEKFCRCNHQLEQ